MSFKSFIFFTLCIALISCNRGPRENTPTTTRPAPSRLSKIDGGFQDALARIESFSSAPKGLEKWVGLNSTTSPGADVFLTNLNKCTSYSSARMKLFFENLASVPRETDKAQNYRMQDPNCPVSFWFSYFPNSPKVGQVRWTGQINLTPNSELVSTFGIKQWNFSGAKIFRDLEGQLQVESTVNMSAVTTRSGVALWKASSLETQVGQNLFEVSHNLQLKQIGYELKIHSKVSSQNQIIEVNGEIPATKKDGFDLLDNTSLLLKAWPTK